MVLKILAGCTTLSSPSGLLVVQELEIQIKQYGISEVTVNPQDYISRNEHARICDSRVSARDSELQVRT